MVNPASNRKFTRGASENSQCEFFEASYDVLIAGGGIVGSTMAATLGHLGLSVALIERQPEAAIPPLVGTVSVRVSTLSCATRALLMRIGAWQLLPLDRIGVFRHMEVWDSRANASVCFDADDTGLSALGYVVENPVLQYALETLCKRLPGVVVYRGEQVQEWTTDVAATVVHTGNNRLSGELLIGADGADSEIRALAKIAVSRTDYAQTAVVAHLCTSDSHQHTAWQRFLPAGPIALLPLADGSCSLVWSTTADHAKALSAMSEPEFADAVTAASQQRLGTVESVESREAFPLAGLQAERYLSDRVALIGDAAHVVHPLAGQGLNLGLLDVAALAQVIKHARDKCRAIGAPDTLRRYERWRRGQNVAFGQLLTAFNAGFRARSSLLRYVRGLGLNLTGRTRSLRRLFAASATGQIGDIPELARLEGVIDVWDDGLTDTRG